MTGCRKSMGVLKDAFLAPSNSFTGLGRLLMIESSLEARFYQRNGQAPRSLPIRPVVHRTDSNSVALCTLAFPQTIEAKPIVSTAEDETFFGGALQLLASVHWRTVACIGAQNPHQLKKENRTVIDTNVHVWFLAPICHIWSVIGRSERSMCPIGRNAQGVLAVYTNSPCQVAIELLELLGGILINGVNHVQHLDALLAQSLKEG